MSWAKHAIEALRRGETTKVRPRVHSMRSKVIDCATVTPEPIDPDKLQVGDMALIARYPFAVASIPFILSFVSAAGPNLIRREEPS